VLHYDLAEYGYRYSDSRVDLSQLLTARLLRRQVSLVSIHATSMKVTVLLFASADVVKPKKQGYSGENSKK
jgi:hypothetical protein